MARKLLLFLIAYTSAFVGLMCLIFAKAPMKNGDHAVLGMGITLNLVWSLAGGLLMVRYRQTVTRWMDDLPGRWQVKFVFFCTLLAMAEEVVTTTLTNLAPLYGAKVGEAYITASANYIDVITRHSVIVFVPMFVGWACILSRLRFTPTEVFLLFGASGSISEAQFAGNPMQLVAGFWFFIYGLMVWLPAYLAPETLKRPRWWHYPMAVVLPGLFVAPVAFVMGVFFPHPKIDFGAPSDIKSKFEAQWPESGRQAVRFASIRREMRRWASKEADEKVK